MSTMPKRFYDKKYVFDVTYYEYTNITSIIVKCCERVNVYADHSKYAYAKCSMYIFKTHRDIKKIESIELLYSEPNN